MQKLFLGMEPSDSTYLSSLEIRAYNKALYKFICYFTSLILTAS